MTSRFAKLPRSKPAMPGAQAIATLKLRAKNGSVAAADELRRLGLASDQTPKAVTSAKVPVADPIRLARNEAKARAANVMGSSAYAGREKQAAELLMMSCNSGTRFSSSTAIIAELKTRPTDAELAAQQAQSKQAEIEAAWSNAAKRVGAGMGGLGR